MRCRGPLVTLLATAAVLTTASAEVTITDNGYSGLLVGISKDVPEDDGPQLIEAIKVGDQTDSQTNGWRGKGLTRHSPDVTTSRTVKLIRAVLTFFGTIFYFNAILFKFI